MKLDKKVTIPLLKLADGIQYVYTNKITHNAKLIQPLPYKADISILLHMYNTGDLRIYNMIEAQVNLEN